MLFYSGQSLLSRQKITNITAVERRAARVISKFPFSPTSAGTRMNTSVITLKTSQCWKTHNYKIKSTPELQSLSFNTKSS